MPATDRRLARALIVALSAAPSLVTSASAQTITALPEQTSRIRLSNHDINHVVCTGGDIDDVKFSAEKQIAVEKGGSDAWIKFLVKETDDNGAVTRSFVTTPSEFFVSCNGAVYPLYAEPADIAAQTVVLAPGAAQRAKANADLMGPLADEERAVSITMALLQDRLPASFSVQAPAAGPLRIGSLPGITLEETSRVAIDGAGLSASEYRVEASASTTLDERSFLVSALGANIFAVTLDASDLKPGDAAHLVIVRRGAGQ
jgi:conjugal transfer pilus assembly protein TraK